MSSEPPCPQCGTLMEVRESPTLEELICHHCGSYLSRIVDPSKPLAASDEDGVMGALELQKPVRESPPHEDERPSGEPIDS